MALLRLAPEILFKIFDLLDNDFFDHDLGLLTVCKRWSEFALPTYHQTLDILDWQLRKFIAGELVKTPYFLERNLRTLTIELRGFLINAPCIEGSYAKVPGEGPFRTWKQDLNNDLIQLATIVQRSRGLRTLHIKAKNYDEDCRSDCGLTYLTLSSIQGFLSLENLSVLVLDLPLYFYYLPGGKEVSRHICSDISALFSTLQVLQIRKQHICPDILKPKDPNARLSLRTVAICLSLADPGETRYRKGHSRRCITRCRDWRQLKEDMVEQAQILATQMAEPKVVKIITHELPGLKRASLDVLTGKTTQLWSRHSWDKDGAVIYSDSDSDSDSDTDSDIVSLEEADLETIGWVTDEEDWEGEWEEELQEDSSSSSED
ncbi:hypothetical protein F4774DRAFT_426834 [Daldinia eschscholtzii]|nr:hypothetical protein F4774DRAFT_426834 [Daldinia eschscholtzii]